MPVHRLIETGGLLDEDLAEHLVLTEHDGPDAHHFEQREDANRDFSSLDWGRVMLDPIPKSWFARPARSRRTITAVARSTSRASAAK